jgi:hypothetical protein
LHNEAFLAEAFLAPAFLEAALPNNSSGMFTELPNLALLSQCNLLMYFFGVVPVAS